MALSFLRSSLAVLLFVAPIVGQGQPIDLGDWQVVQYEFNSQPDADWQLLNNDTTAWQAVNADASILLSDFDAADRAVSGKFRVGSNSDDDMIGFVFGYQGRGQYYLFDWKRTAQFYSGGLAEQGMNVKIVHTPPGTDPSLLDLWITAGTPNVTLLHHNEIRWQGGVDYDFELRFVPGNFEITVSEAGQVLEHWVVNDATYSNGEFGFYNYSQGDVYYEGFRQKGIPKIYCTAKTNSQGCVPALTTTGFASFSDPQPFEISAGLLINNKSGVLCYGVNGPDALPFNGGFLCIATPFELAVGQGSNGNPPPDDCSGSLTLDFNAWLQAGKAPSVTPGNVVNAQFVYRDPKHADGTGFGLTEGVEFPVLP